MQFAYAPFVIAVCATLWVLTLLASGGAIGGSGLLSMLSPSSDAIREFGASGAIPVFADGEWWTVLSAGWLHAGLLHIGLNMYWVWQMGPAIADLFGSARTVIIYTVGGIVGFALSSIVGRYPLGIPFLNGGLLTLGASAPVCGLIGALYHYGRSGNSMVKQMAMSIMVQVVIFGLLIPGIDNFAHLGGFAGGYLASSWLDPTSTRERGDHTIIALLCLLASLLAVIASVLKFHGML
jgi:rhomboid protease GluP